MTITTGRIAINGSAAPTGAVAWNASQYEAEVNTILTQIHEHAAGRAVIDAIAQPMVIVPWPRPDECNAVGGPTDWWASTPSGQPIMQCGGTAPGTPWQPHGVAVMGTGAGSAARVQFTPGMWGPSSVCAGGPGSLPDEILLHEIVHGMRATAGLLHCQPMGLHYDTEEEFVAVAITNVYMSERGATQLRANHLGFEPLTNVDTFYGGVMEQRQMIRRLFAQQPQLAHALSCVRASFNPFSEHR